MPALVGMTTEENIIRGAMHVLLTTLVMTGIFYRLARLQTPEQIVAYASAIFLGSCVAELAAYFLGF